MQFIASITRRANDIRKIMRLWQESGDPRNPLKRILITPLFTSPNTLQLIRGWKEDGLIEEVYFDSGGYFVQMGRISYEEMYWQLLQFYKANQWADWYVLPDYVPLSSDTREDVWYKVKVTAKRGDLFFKEMPANLRERAIPVLQGHTEEQIEYCLERHLNLDVQRMGFGSFGTNGKDSSVNTLTINALNFLSDLTPILGKRQIKLHAFGVGTPPVIYLLDRVGVHSFDSVGWMKTAGYGKIFMPFVRAYNVTYRDPAARGLKEQDFYALKRLTGHSCYFCHSFAKLTESRDYRVMHNLTVVLDTIEALTHGQCAHVEDILTNYSPSYAKLYAGVAA